MLEARLVKQGAHHALEDADLRAEAETEQHHEEQGGPEGGAGDLGEHVRHDDEGESCPLGRVIQLLDQGAVFDGGQEVRVRPKNKLVKIERMKRSPREGF